MGTRKRTNETIMQNYSNKNKSLKTVESSQKSSLVKDAYNISILLILYFLQGIPLGLVSAIPYMIQGGKSQTSYETLANFSLVIWPFSMKLIWAPIVDALYIKKFGRRKSWLLPVQYAIGLDLFYISYSIDDWFQRPFDEPWGPIGSNGEIKTMSLTLAFFFLTFLAATQDIVVDGWALTMLSKENVGWASTCNTVGQVLGNLVAFLLFLALESPEVSNNYFRSTPVPKQGIISSSGFLYFWAIVFIISTTLIAIFKSEDSFEHLSKQNETINIGQIVLRSMKKCKNQTHEFEIESEPDNMNRKEDFSAQLCNEDPNSKELSLFETYKVMFGVLKLRPIKIYIVTQFMIKFAYSASESIFALKLIELGASKEKLVFLSLFSLPLQMFLPFILAKWSNGPKPLSLFSKCVIPRLFITSLAGPLVYMTYYFRTANLDFEDSPRKFSAIPDSIGISSSADYFLLQQLQTLTNTDHMRPLKYTLSNEFYALILAHGFLYTFVQYPMFVSQMAFNAKISDPNVGGTYMTLLNTICNLAGTIPQTLMMYFVDPLTSRSCTNVKNLKAGFTVLSIPDYKLMEFNVNFETGSPFQASTIKTLENLGINYLYSNATCKPMTGVELCEQAGGTCVTNSEGFYVELIVCAVVGVITYFFLRKMLSYLDNLSQEAFHYKLSE